jgi:hypothetical protein
MKALMAELDHVAGATLASMTRLTRALASRAAANIQERVRRATASSRPGAVGMFLALVRDETGDKASGTLGGVAGTLGAGVGVQGGITLGEWAGILGGAVEGLGLGFG